MMGAEVDAVRSSDQYSNKFVNTLAISLPDHQQDHYLGHTLQKRASIEGVRERTRDALARLDGVPRHTRSRTVGHIDTSKIGEPSLVTRPRRSMDQLQSNTSIPNHQQNPTLEARRSVRKSKSLKNIKSQPTSPTYSVFPSPPRKSKRHTRMFSEDLVPPVPPVPPVPAIPSYLFSSTPGNSDSLVTWHAPSQIDSTLKSARQSVDKTIINKEIFRPKTSTGSESAPAPVGSKPSFRHRKRSMSEVPRPHLQKTNGTIKRHSKSHSRTENITQIQILQDRLDPVDTLEKKQKSSSWEVPTLFRRRNTLEKGKHRSEPTLREEEVQETFSTSTSLEITSLPSPFSGNGDEALTSPFRSEFSDDSASEETDDESGKLVKLMKKMKKKLTTKKA